MALIVVSCNTNENNNIMRSYNDDLPKAKMNKMKKMIFEKKTLNYYIKEKEKMCAQNSCYISIIHDSQSFLP